MYRFTNDYSEGAHPSILEAMTATNLDGNFGYGCDPHCEHAAALIRQKIGRPDADVHFFVGGTQTNATCICAFLRPHEAAIAAHSGHICVHETGAVEATGHKCIAMPAAPGGKPLASTGDPFGVAVVGAAAVATVAGAVAVGARR